MNLEEQKSLEEAMERLVPAPLNSVLRGRLDAKLSEAETARRSGKVIFFRFVPVAAAACLMLTGVVYYHLELRHSGGENPVAAVEVATPAPAVIDLIPVPGAPTLDTELTFDSDTLEGPAHTASPQIGGLVPVSTRQHVEAVDKGPILTIEGEVPLREVNVRIQDEYEWLDLESQSSIKVFKPREEKILVPVDTQ